MSLANLFHRPSVSRSLVENLSQSLSRPRELLLVDDDKMYCELFVRKVGYYHARVETAQEAADAITRMYAKEYDLVFVDVRLNVDDGIDLFRSIRSRWPRQAVCFLSGFIGQREIDRINEIGFAAMIRKPMDLFSGAVFEDMMRTFHILPRGEMEDCSAAS